MLESPDMESRRKGIRPIYLASNSPRRRELLALTGLEFQLLAVSVDETPMPGEEGAGYVSRIALAKLTAASSGLTADGLVIAADTAVVDLETAGQTVILGKPVDPKDAVDMLRRLRGSTHQVYTALAILPARGASMVTDLCVTNVPMRNYNEDEIAAYVASGDPMDKAGAYAIQHPAFHPVDELDGCFANVMGLPLCHLARNLIQLGLTPLENVPKVCQSALHHSCQVYPQVHPERILIRS